MPINNDQARQRIKVIRLAFCERVNGRPEAAKNFALRLGIEDTTWNNFERKGRPGLDNAVRLVEEFQGLTLDYIYLGDKSTLPVSMQKELSRAEAEAQDSGSSRPFRTNFKTGRGGRSARSQSCIASTKSKA